MIVGQKIKLIFLFEIFHKNDLKIRFGCRKFLKLFCFKFIIQIHNKVCRLTNIAIKKSGLFFLIKESFNFL